MEENLTEILLYNSPNGKVKMKVFLQDETIWLSQAKIAELFGVDRSVVTKHIGNIFKTRELHEKVVCANFAHTTLHGAIAHKTQEKLVKFYNLDVIISVGYRVNSTQATTFRIWATERLKEYIIKGFTMDDERLKTPNNIFGKDYFEEQLERQLYSSLIFPFNIFSKIHQAKKIDSFGLSISQYRQSIPQNF